MPNKDPFSFDRAVDSSPPGEANGSCGPAPEVLALHGAYSQHRELLSELDHRVRNMLQIVIGLCRLTLRRAVDLKAFESALMGRIDALAKSYELLTRAGWQNVLLDELLRAQLQGHSPADRFSIHGEDIPVHGEAVLTMGLLFHELACNARQHGAWSLPEGSVEIIWRVEEGALIFQWVERGAPPLTHAHRHGFGTELLKSQLQHELGAHGAMEFTANGLHVTLEVPLFTTEPQGVGSAAVLRRCENRKGF